MNKKRLSTLRWEKTKVSSTKSIYFITEFGPDQNKHYHSVWIESTIVDGKTSHKLQINYGPYGDYGIRTTFHRVHVAYIKKYAIVFIKERLDEDESLFKTNSEE